MQFCWCVYSTPVSCDDCLKGFRRNVGYLFFLREDHVVFALASFLRMSLLFEICLPVGILLIPKEGKHWEMGF
jgi:hypothetical protein